MSDGCSFGRRDDHRKAAAERVRADLLGGILFAVGADAGREVEEGSLAGVRFCTLVNAKRGLIVKIATRCAFDKDRAAVLAAGSRFAGGRTS